MAKLHDWHSISNVLDLGEHWSPGMRSAARPLWVLEFFDEVRRPARAIEISERLELPQSTVSVLLKALTALGFLDYDPLTHLYQSSLRVTLLGSWRDCGRLRAGALMAMLEGIAERTGLAASLSSRSGIYIRYLQTVQQEKPGVPRIKLSARRYAVWSTAGIVLLAGLAERDVERLLRNTLAQGEPHAKRIVASDVKSMLATAREQGWLSARGLHTPHVRSIARVVPVEATGYNEPLALTLASSQSELGYTDDELAAIMASAVDELGR